MHARHRSPGNGYRSTTPNTSRISPDDYHRSFNRPLLRPNSNSFQPPQPPPRKPDIFVDAGRLAAEYLVSQGILPPNVLSLPSKWSNGSFKRISRLPEPESFNLGQEGRTSALARLGNAVTDSVAVGSSRRRFVGDEFGFRNGSRGRRRPPYRGGGGYGSDWVSRDYNNNNNNSNAISRSGSFQDQDRLSNDIGDYYYEHDDDDVVVSEQQQQPINDLVPKSETLDDSKPNESSEIEKEEGEEEEEEEEGDCSNNTSSTDLLTKCKFAKVPTRIRSSLSSSSLLSSSKSPKLDSTPTTTTTTTATTIEVEEQETNSATCSDIQRAQSAENVGESSHIQHIKCERSVSMPNRAFVYDDNEEKERVDKRGFEEDDVKEGVKRPRETSDRIIVDIDDNDNDNDKDDGDGVGGGDFSQEKQLFPSSFKICDLNLMQVSETHENHDCDAATVNMYQSISERRREAKPMDIGLSMSNCNNNNNNNNNVVSGESSKRPQSDHHKEIEVIDLENDSAQEDKDLVMEDRKTETVYTDLDEIHNHAQNTGGIPDTQDGYGLMISELLGNDFPNCSAVPEHINPMHNDIGLPNEEGAIGDDDSIYMSLGEIPLTFLRPWEQPPPQEYEKPF